jgi:hypothetical protein
MVAVTGVGSAVGWWVVPNAAGGDPFATFYCGCRHAFPSWLWPAAIIPVLSLVWAGFLALVVIRPARRAARSAEGRRRAASAPDASTGRDRDAEGWYVDPYGRHEGRWFSMGTATALVRDQGVESSDPAPDGPGAEPLSQTPAPQSQTAGGDGLRRVGDGGSGAYDPGVALDAVLDATTWLPDN